MTFAGLDVHAGSTHVAALEVASGELKRIRFGPGSEEVIAWLAALPQPVHGCYEAGPTGFALYRAAEQAGLRLDVVAPSKTPRAAGDRIKSDRKDAELLCRLLMAGQLKPVTVPAPAVEAARHLARAREQVRVDLMRCRHRVSKLLLLHGRVYPERSTWTQAHRRWLSRQRFARPAQPASWLGLVPSLDQWGESRLRGSITRPAPSSARRLLVEAAWHYLREPRIGVTLRNRQQGQPAHVLQIAWRAQHRLY